MKMTVNKIFGLIAVPFAALFAWIFLFKHIPAVGWDYVFKHWGSYLLMMALGTSVMFLFYGMAKVCEMLSILSEQQNDGNERQNTQQPCE